MNSKLLPPLLILSLLSACCVSETPEKKAAPQASGPATEREPLLHLFVPSKSEEGAAKFKADWSYDLVVTEGWSAHVHVIPPGQLVPPHRHPENDEFSWVASGTAQWTSWVAGEPPTTRDVGPGTALIAPKGAVHGVRNPGPGDLSIVVIHQPSFGQNWYVMPEEVTSEAPSPVVPVGVPTPEGLFPGWTLEHTGRQESSSFPADSLYLVSAGSGHLAFENKELPLMTGHFIKVPAGLEHSLSPKPDQETELSLWVLRIPR